MTFESDLIVLRPVDPNAGNRGMLYSVANRGSATSLPLSAGAFAMPGLSDRIEPGDGFLLRHGYTVVWSGWQWDVVRRPGMVGLAAPEALGDDGAPIAGSVRVRVQPQAATGTMRLAGLALDPNLAPPLPYPPADLDNTDAVLTVQDRPDAVASPIDRASWRFIDADHIALDGGFEAGRIYEVVYRTARCPVVGVGFLAVRDAVSWLRHADEEKGNPVAGRVDFALATGASQSGRFLRHFLSDGMNVDENADPVFDGVHIHIAGGRRGEFNSRYGQPGVIWRGPGDRTAVHARMRCSNVNAKSAGCPRWSLRTARPNTGAAMPGSRTVMRQPARMSTTRPRFGTTCSRASIISASSVSSWRAMVPAVNPPNGLSAVAPERAIFVALEHWVRHGVEPPASRAPRLDDGTAIDRAAALARFAARPGVSVPDADALPIGSGEASAAIVSALDDDGNEVAGVRLPQLVEPVATFTGWNVRPPIDGLPDLMPDFLGSRVPLGAGDRAQPAVRRSRRLRGAGAAAARGLVADRFLLARRRRARDCRCGRHVRRIARRPRKRAPVAFAGARRAPECGQRRHVTVPRADGHAATSCLRSPIAGRR